jgi:hypothetical protein
MLASNCFARFFRQHRIVWGFLGTFVLAIAWWWAAQPPRSNTTTPAEWAERLDNVAWTIGDWRGQPAEIDEKQFKVAEVDGYLARRYVQRDTGQEVLLLILSGKPGPISVQTIVKDHGDVGFEVDGRFATYRVEASAGGRAATFTKADMHQPGPGLNERLRVYWTWKSNGPWRAPKHQRWAFGGVPVLYKMYLIYQSAPGVKLEEKDPCQDFLPELLKELEAALSPPH